MKHPSPLRPVAPPPCIYLDDVVSLAFTPERCRNCGHCREVCPRAVFVQLADRVDPAQRGLCIECGACARNCPHGAIHLNPGAGCITLLLKQRWEHLRQRLAERLPFLH